MEKSEFIYYFSKLYFGEAVKETILIENWEEGDFDIRYIEYAHVFEEIKKECLKGKNEKEILNFLTKNKINLVKAFNEKMSQYFLEQLNQYPIKASSAQEIINNNIPLGDSINPELLRIFRELEERVSN
ncbi:MAG: hypothetical protein FWB86_00120 [Treponema sp.]|nr:hypothetical protein [Treponema sp.]MCL2251543.1 hypothetical protein [Treponema sp.]